ncbi:cytochrome b subunit of succinate dehydrogenase, Sdh3p [Nowakowskiella sp. JEL0078]|nr:cytochrome b subunit of succinate dehydrogenase, Sdh3p [Nowakowskiella sp. JEL0078]
MNSSVMILQRAGYLRSTLLRSSLPVGLKTCLPVQRFISSTPDSRPTLETDTFEKGKAFGRPRSPHLLIYQPQLTWYMSIFHRFTGVGLAGLIYAASIKYAISPFESGAAVAALYSLPTGIILLGKTAIAGPFWYHSLNGIRHLIWDTGRSLTIKGVYSSGYLVLGGTAALTLLSLVL